MAIGITLTIPEGKKARVVTTEGVQHFYEPDENGQAEVVIPVIAGVEFTVLEMDLDEEITDPSIGTDAARSTDWVKDLTLDPGSSIAAPDASAPE